MFSIIDGCQLSIRAEGLLIMARQIVDIEGLEDRMPFTRHQIYKFIRRPESPLPHKKIGKKLYFDLERVDRWFDQQPGRDETFGCELSG